ncbi:MAG: hypothetical protein ABI690_15885 [Chloroflexota bacterium]
MPLLVLKTTIFHFLIRCKMDSVEWVVRVSIETVNIVRGLQKLPFRD